jgi:hypothetical protein
MATKRTSSDLCRCICLQGRSGVATRSSAARWQHVSQGCAGRAGVRLAPLLVVAASRRRVAQAGASNIVFATLRRCAMKS